MTATRLTPDLAPADLSAWHLILRISPRSISALILGPQGPDRTVVSHSEALPDSSLEALENAIYDNPLILSDFGQVDILIATSQRIMLPASIPAEMDEEIIETMLPDSDGPRRLISAPMPGEMRVIAAIDSETLGFLQRTFPDGHFSLAIASLAEAATRMRPDGKPFSLAIADKEELTIICLDSEGKLSFANRFDVSGASDCAYFILAAPAPESETLTIGGEADLRNETIEQLRLATPSLEPTPLFLSPEIANLRRQADNIPLDMFFK